MTALLHGTLYALFGGVAFIVLLRLLRGTIKTAGMLAATIGVDCGTSPERLQLFAVSVFAIAAYAFDTAGSELHTSFKENRGR